MGAVIFFVIFSLNLYPAMTIYLLYIATIFLIIATPGPSTLLMMQHSALFGAKRCFFNALGSISASFLLISAALAGIAMLLTGFWLDVLSALGATLLIYVGISSFKKISTVNDEDSRKSNKDIFRESFFTGISNPKDIVFFVSLLPQFINQSIPYYQSAIMLAMGWIVLDFSIMMGYAIVAHIILKNFDDNAINYTRMASGALITVIGGALLSNSIVRFL